jgi:hypothetical protein
MSPLVSDILTLPLTYHTYHPWLGTQQHSCDGLVAKIDRDEKRNERKINNVQKDLDK